nr:MAG TPA: hypothetical protein [Caudoviricetes sp.]
MKKILNNIYKVLALLLIFSITAILIVYAVYTLIMQYRISIMQLKLDLVGIGVGFLLFIVLSLLQLIAELIDKNNKDNDKKDNQTGNGL